MIPGLERSLGEENATHSSSRVFIIPWTEEPGGLQSMGSQRIRHHWATNATTTTNNLFRKKAIKCNTGHWCKSIRTNFALPLPKRIYWLLHKITDTKLYLLTIFVTIQTIVCVGLSFELLFEAFVLIYDFYGLCVGDPTFSWNILEPTAEKSEHCGFMSQLYHFLAMHFRYIAS